MKYKIRLTFAYYSVTFWDFKSFAGVPKTWKVPIAKNIYIFLTDVQIPFAMILNPDFS